MAVKKVSDVAKNAGLSVEEVINKLESYGLSLRKDEE